MCKDVVVMKLLHLGESRRCKKNGYCLLGSLGCDKEFLVAIECRICQELAPAGCGSRQEGLSCDRAGADLVSR